MVEYKCPRCGYTTIKKSSMKDHYYKRKNVCNDKNESNIDFEKCKLMFHEGKLRNKEYSIKQEETIKLIEQKYEKRIQQLEEQIRHQGNVYTNCGNTTIHNTFTINSFKDTDYSALKDDIIKCIQNQDPQLKVPMFERIVDTVHFNKDKPENHNIYKPNVRDNRILTYDGEGFIIDKNAIDTLLVKLEKLINDSADPEENKDIIRKLKHHLNLKRTDGDYVNQTMDDIAVSLYNGRNTVKETHKSK